MSQPNRHDVAPADLDRFAKLVQMRLGIREDAGNLRRALEERMAATGAASSSTYVERLGSHQAAKEWSALASRLAVGETYFFRNIEHWRAFVQYVIPEIVGKQGTQFPSLRIWSAGCSTGEEPYTVAMVLAEMGLGKLVGAGSILATDLVEDSLATARKATYSANSFRGVAKERIERFLQRNGNGWTVKEELRKAVTFRRLNLADPTAVAAFTAAQGPFHVIFCRNVLIYFHPAVCRHLLGQLADALACNGMLFLGHAEFPGLWSDALESVAVGNTFAWRKHPDAANDKGLAVTDGLSAEDEPGGAKVADRLAAGGAEAPAGAQPRPRLGFQPEDAGHLSPGALPTAARTGAAVSLACNNASQTKAAGDVWPEIVEMIDYAKRGRSQEAVSAARRFASGNELLPEAHYALGVALETAEDSARAIDAYRKAAFLDSGFAHAHWRLALLWASLGRSDRAVSEARWAVRAIARETDARIWYLSRVDRPELTHIMGHTLEWLLQQKKSSITCASG